MIALDKVSHPKLIHKLEAYGIDYLLVRWNKLFFTDRQQRVIIGDNYSEWEEVTSSVHHLEFAVPVWNPHLKKFSVL